MQENTVSISVVVKGQQHTHKIALREDMLARSPGDVEDYLREVANFCVTGIVRSIKGESHDTFCKEIRARERHRSKPILIGCVIVGPPRAQGANPVLQLLSGKKIFFRRQKQAHDFVHNNSKTVGCDNAAWKKALELGAEYMVTYAALENQLYVAHKNSVNIVDNYGQGMQARAKLSDCRILGQDEGVGPYSFSEPVIREKITVNSEE